MYGQLRRYVFFYLYIIYYDYLVRSSENYLTRLFFCYYLSIVLSWHLFVAIYIFDTFFSTYQL